MKKILHISKFYTPYAGGIEDVCYSVVGILKEDPSVVQRIICFNDVNKTVHETYEGIEVTRVAIQAQLFSQPISLSYYSQLKKVIKEFHPDYIHLHLPNPLLGVYVNMLKPASCKVILHWHSDIVAQKLLYKLVKRSETKLVDRAYKIIATSPNYCEDSAPLKRAKDKVVIIPNIIKEGVFEETPELKEKVTRLKEQYQHVPIVMFLGRHVPYKGIEYLIEATQYMQSQCKILVGGSGPLTPSLKSKTTDERVQFLGRIPEDMLPAYYYAADVFAFPSVTKNEAFGVALAEAMYCYSPAVTFTINGSGVNWVSMHRQTGIEVENQSSIQLAKAIDELIENKELRCQYGLAARARVEELFLQKSIKQAVFDLYT